MGNHAAAGMNNLNPEHWYIKAGIRQKWTPFGATILYGEYSDGNDQIGLSAWDAHVRASNINWWGVGLVQEIDAAAMSMWVKYRNVDGSLTTQRRRRHDGIGCWQERPGQPADDHFRRDDQLLIC